MRSYKNELIFTLKTVEWYGKKIVNGSLIIVSLACSVGVLLRRVDVKRLANSTDYVWFGVRVDVGGRGRGKANIQCLFSSCSPNWKMRRETGDGGRGWRGRKRDILKRIRSHGIDRGSNLFAIFSSHNLPCGGLGVPLSFYFNCFFNQNFNFRPQPCFRGFEIMLSKCKFAFSQPYSLHHPSLSTDQPPSALS